MRNEKVQAMYYENADGFIHCILCPHNCRIAEGKTGICGVRKNENGVLYAESYGEVSSLALDPIEKKPLFHFHPGKKILSVGSYGCNFRCSFCQNHSISMEHPETVVVSPKALAEQAKTLENEGNIGVAYTYNEPLMGYEYVLDCAEAVRALNMKNVLVTNGFIEKEPLLRLLPYIDAMNIDLKSGNDAFYKKICGGRLQNVWDTIELAAKSCHVEITTLIIPDENDGLEEMDGIAKTLAEINSEIPLHINRFFPKYKMLDKKQTSVETVFMLSETTKKHLKYVYVGR